MCVSVYVCVPHVFECECECASLNMSLKLSLKLSFNVCLGKLFFEGVPLKLKLSLNVCLRMCVFNVRLCVFEFVV